MESIMCYELFGHTFLFNVLLIILFFTLIYSDIQEAGYFAVIVIIIAIGLNYFWGTFPLLSIFTLRNCTIYLFVGFVFSIIRTYFKGKELTAYDRKNSNTNRSRKASFNLQDHVYRWITMWPISGINWICGRLLVDAWNFIYMKIGVLYRSVFNM
jgi:hypothetical protein